MTKKTKIFSLIMSCIVLISNLVFPTFAANIPESKSAWIITKSEKGNEYLINRVTGEEIYKSYKIDSNNKLIEMSFKERLAILNNSDQNRMQLNSLRLYSSKGEGVLRSPNTFTRNRYSKIGNSTTYGTAVKVTPDIAPGGTVSQANAITISNSFQFSVSGTYDITDALKSTAGFTWTNTAMTASTLTTSFTNKNTIGSNIYQAVYFTPKLNVAYGSIYTDTFNTANVLLSTKYIGQAYGYSPCLLNNQFADGLVDFKNVK